MWRNLERWMLLQTTGRQERKPKDQGVTLVEVILVVAILGFGITATSVLFSTNLRTGASNREQLACAALVHDVMERLRTLPFRAENGKSIETLATYLGGSNTLNAFYQYMDVPPEEWAAFTAVIPNVLDFSTLTLSERSHEYMVELKIRWKSTMPPVRVMTTIVEGGINDLLQAR
ncbi:MAG: type II secretion system protein [Atribacterota bacterium]